MTTLQCQTDSCYLFSAIIPNYNCASMLPEAVASLLDQKHQFDEIIIVDDGSTDNSIQIINDMMRLYSSIKLIQHSKNKGVCAALNTGIQAARGDYILLGAADDYYHPNLVATASAVLSKLPDIGLVCGEAIVKKFDLNKTFHRPLPYIKNSYYSPEKFKKLMLSQYVGFNAGGGMLMNRLAVIEAGGLRNVLKWHSDWVLYFIVAMRKGFYYSENIFITINMRKSSYSGGRNNWREQKMVIKNVIKEYEDNCQDLYHDFKMAGLLPGYSLKYLGLLVDARFRRFFSLALFWKLIINNTMVVRIGRLFPYRIILFARKYLRA